MYILIAVVTLRACSVNSQELIILRCDVCKVELI